MEGFRAGILVDDCVGRFNALVFIDRVFGKSACRPCNAVFLLRRGPTNAIASDLAALDDVGAPMVVECIWGDNLLVVQRMCWDK